MRFKTSALLLGALLLAVVSGEPASGQPAAGGRKPATLEELAAYQGPDRTQLLVEGAKKEGALTIYASMPVEDMTALTDAFKRKYGIQANIWRSRSENVLDRTIKEAQAGRHEVDVIETNGPELEALFREKLTQPVVSPHHADLIKGAVPAHRGWAGARLNMFVQAYNTRSVKKADLPKSWTDLLDPKWKSLLVVEYEDWDWFAGVVTHLGEERGLKLFQDLAAGNGLGVRKGHLVLTELLAAGEIQMALSAYSFHAQQYKEKGAPVDWFVIPPAIARPNGVAIARKAPHPHAALLFYDFELSEGQEVLKAREMLATNGKYDETAKSTPMNILDPALLIDGQAKWSKLWEQVVLKGRKK